MASACQPPALTWFPRFSCRSSKPYIVTANYPDPVLVDPNGWRMLTAFSTDPISRAFAAVPLFPPFFLQVIQAQQVITANYPDPVLVDPNGWRVGARARSDMIIASAADSDKVQVVNSATSNTKLAPSIAIANTNTLTGRPTFGYTTANAYARPGLQYGVTLASADQQMDNMSEW